MNNQLARLILDYQKSVQTAVALMYRSGIQMPSSCADWIETDIPLSGTLDGGAHYIKHGAGCEVSLTAEKVDFDFGKHGEIDGFDVWRLVKYAGVNLVNYGFGAIDEVQDSFEKSVTDGSIVYSGDCLYYTADVQRLFAVDVDCRVSGDMLPSRDHDPVLTLYAHYFLAADLMRKNYEKLNSKWSECGRLSGDNEVKLRIYISSWLGFLGVTCAGFRDLNMRLLLQSNRPESFQELIPISDGIGRMMKKHSNPLREFRNNVFHLRKNLDVTRNFFAIGEDRLPWAHELHEAIAGFLSEYRILCEVHYVMHGRKGEMDSNRFKKRQKLRRS